MASYELNGSNISVTIEDAMQLSVNVGESAALEVGQAINYIQSGRAELQPLVNAAAQSANNAETSAQNASESATAALGYAERAETAAETAENMADKDLSNLSETGEARFAEKADDNAVVHLTGNETITGTKTLDGVLRVTDDQKLIGLSGSLIIVKNGTKDSWLTEGYLQFYDNGVVTELSKTSFKLNNSAISATGIVSTAISNSNALITSGGVYTALANKQDALVSGENIKTINGQSVLGDGNLVIASVTSWGNITGTLSAQTDLQTALNAKANTADIPTATSDLTNDSGYITLSALNGYATENWVENKGYLTEIPAEYVTDSELTAKGYQTAADVETAITAKGYTTMSAVEAKGYITNAALVGYATESYVTTAVGTETTARQNADNNLQSQIDAITASSDVTDIVGTYAELQNYDTSTLPPNSIIKVLQDESRNNETTYYRWVITGGVGAWSLIGEEGPYYTMSAADAKFATQTALSTGLSGKQDTISDLDTIRSGASAGATAVQPSDLATVATSGSYNDLSNKPTIPTVPTNVSAFTNDAGYITSSALSGYATQNWVGQQGFITGITSSDVTTALGYTPYNSSNPSGYITSSALTGYATESYVTTATANMQTTGNLVTSISSSSTNTQYPSAKCVYDIVGDIESAINTIRGV